jgi:hypothetical protein
MTKRGGYDESRRIIRPFATIAEPNSTKRYAGCLCYVHGIFPQIALRG